MVVPLLYIVEVTCNVVVSVVLAAVSMNPWWSVNRVYYFSAASGPEADSPGAGYTVTVFVEVAAALVGVAVIVPTVERIVLICSVLYSWTRIVLRLITVMVPGSHN